MKLFDDEILEVGTIVSVKDGVAQVKRLKSVTSGEMVFLGYLKIKGMVLSLEQKIVIIYLFGGNGRRNKFKIYFFIRVLVQVQ